MVLNCQSLKATLSQPSLKATLSQIRIVRAGYPMYTGDYVVTPLAGEETILPTQDKALQNNVTVLEIPYYEVSNASGQTIYIGTEIGVG